MKYALRVLKKQSHTTMSYLIFTYGCYTYFSQFTNPPSSVYQWTQNTVSIALEFHGFIEGGKKV